MDTTTPNTGGIEITAVAKDKAKGFLAQENNPKNAVRVTFDAHGKILLSIDEPRAGDDSLTVDGIPMIVEHAVAALASGLKVDWDDKQGGFSFSGSARALDPSAVQAVLHPADEHGGHGGVNYMQIFWYLVVLTVAELGIAQTSNIIGRTPMRLMLIVLAVWKATLVAMFFMHLKFEGKWKYVAVIPPLVLAAIVVFALMPDIGNFPSWKMP
jgi:cytochrome c oxidase subunit 4